MQRYRKRPTSKNVQFKKAVGLLVLGTACVGYLFVAGKLGVAVGNLVSPIFADKATYQTVQAVEQDNTLDTAKPTNQFAETVTQTEKSGKEAKLATESINVEAKTLYCVQIGAFSDQGNAEVAAVTLRKRGAAGYIVEDKYWRVMAAGYLSQEDAQKVKEQLEKSGIENTIYDIAYSSLLFDITADEEVMDNIKALFKTYEISMATMHETAMALDEKKITQDEGIMQIEKVNQNMRNSMETIQNMNGKISGDNAVLSNFQHVYESAIQKTEKIINSESLTNVELSSLLKYNYINMFLEFKAYMDQL